jgi:lysophospholipase L1-like esterase
MAKRKGTRLQPDLGKQSNPRARACSRQRSNGLTRARPPGIRRSQALVVLHLVVGLLLASGCAVQKGPEAPKGTHTFQRYVALGDSYSSGEGLEPYLPGSDTDQDRCHRSDQAYANFVTTKHLVFVACSGVTTAAYAKPGSEQPQSLALTRDTDLVTLTLGGNDLDWTGILLACGKIQVQIGHETVHETPDKCSTALEGAPQRLDKAVVELATIYPDVRRAAPRAVIRVLGYPPLFPDRAKPFRKKGCRIVRVNVALGSPTGWQVVLASDVEQKLVDLERKANERIRATVQAQHDGRLSYVDIEKQFGGYQGHTSSCGDTGRPTPWLNSVKMNNTDTALLAVELELHQFSLMEHTLFDLYHASFHPTARGQREMYEALRKSL